MKSYSYKTIYVIAIMSALFNASEVHAEDQLLILDTGGGAEEQIPTLVQESDVELETLVPVLNSAVEVNEKVSIIDPEVPSEQAPVMEVGKLRKAGRPPVSLLFAEGTKEFLSDPARTGSLVGTILAGAAVANPLAPLVGSVVGFMIGKSSAFTQKESVVASRNAFSNRSLTPQAGTQVSSLSGLTGTPPAEGESTVLNFNREILTDVQLDQNEEIVIVGLSEEARSVGQIEPKEAISVVSLSEKVGSDRRMEQEEAIASVGRSMKAEEVKLPVQAAVVALRNVSGERGSELQKQLASACSNVGATQAIPMNCFYYSQ